MEAEAYSLQIRNRTQKGFCAQETPRVLLGFILSQLALLNLSLGSLPFCFRVFFVPTFKTTLHISFLKKKK